MEAKRTRIGWIDELRGLAILAMILHHIAFNCTYFLDSSPDWLDRILESRALGILQMLFVAVFLGLSGLCCHLTRRPWRRVGRVGLAAAAITLVTRIAFPAETIWFGILHCLAVCMALYALSGRQLKKVPPFWGIAASLLLFAVTYRLPDGYILGLALPEAMYTGGLLTVLGLPLPSFQSFDYVPLLPYAFLFLAGVFLGNMHLPEGRVHSRFLAFCGRHSLAVYLVHQPVVFGLFFLFSIVWKG